MSLFIFPALLLHSLLHFDTLNHLFALSEQNQTSNMTEAQFFKSLGRQISTYTVSQHVLVCLGRQLHFPRTTGSQHQKSEAGSQPNMNILNNLVNTLFFQWLKHTMHNKQTIRHAVLVSIKFKSNKPE